MTTSIPASTATAATQSPNRSGDRRASSTENWPLLGAEVLLAALTVVALFGMRRLFADWSYLAPTLVAAIVSHGLSALLRRFRWPLVPATVASGIAMIVVVAAVQYSDTLWLLLPSLDTWRQVGTDLADAWSAFSVVKAPAEVLPGFITAAAIAVWFLAHVADAAAFRIRTAVEAIAPTFIVLVFTSMLGIDSHRLTLSTAFIGIAVFFTLLLRITYPIHPSVPITATRHRQAPALLKAGFGLSVATLAVAVVFGPVLPGVDSRPVVDWKDLDGSSAPRVTLSPLVDARGRLVQQSALELFQVTADRPAYWRVSGLDRFNGSVWGSDQRYAQTEGQLASSAGVSNDDLLVQEFTITGLDGIWLPAAFEPTRLEGENISWNEPTATLVVSRGSVLDPGSTYRVTSLAASPTRDQLISASPVVPADIAATYTALPADFSPRITQAAVDITSAFNTTYEKALALQNHFLDNFVYSLDVEEGHGGNRMENFLFDDNRGYCEQFSGTFAAMARSIGLPTRIAVGFTPGELVDGQYIVRGENYHAWPEVWIDGQWVYFEPTPGRGAPGAQGYTGVAEQQVNSTAGLEGEGGGFVGPQTPTPVIEEIFEDQSGLTEEPLVVETGSKVEPWVIWTGAAIVIIIVVGGLWMLAIPGLDHMRRARRRKRAANERQAIEASWNDLIESMYRSGVPRRSTETHVEFAERAGQRTSADAAALRHIAITVDEARYAPDPPTAATAHDTRQRVRAVEDQLTHGLSWQQKMLRNADPRVLVGAISED
ncbi:MAG: transglutaminase-like putative cysteine protease [Candidatus Poriferisodalaceae bacterium]|jgi:transglutaminase-like putative cysteine protease